MDNLGNAKAALDLFHERNSQVNLQMMFSDHTKLCNPYTDHLEVDPYRENSVTDPYYFFQISPNFSRFPRATFAFSPYLLAPITQNRQMLKSPHSPDPLTSWVPYVLQCAPCSPHVSLTDHTWHAALHMFALWPTHAHCLPHLILTVSFPSIIQLYWYACYPHERLMGESYSIAYCTI